MTPTVEVNPFDILPPNLFNLFSTQGHISLQRHYIAILLRIYALAEFNRFGLTREVVLAEIVDYLKTDGAEKEVASEMSGEILDDDGGLGLREPVGSGPTLLVRREEPGQTTDVRGLLVGGVRVGVGHDGPVGLDGHHRGGLTRPLRGRLGSDHGLRLDLRGGLGSGGLLDRGGLFGLGGRSLLGGGLLLCGGRLFLGGGLFLLGLGSVLGLLDSLLLEVSGKLVRALVLHKVACVKIKVAKMRRQERGK